MHPWVLYNFPILKLEFFYPVMVDNVEQDLASPHTVFSNSSTNLAVCTHVCAHMCRALGMAGPGTCGRRGWRQVEA